MHEITKDNFKLTEAHFTRDTEEYRFELDDVARDELKFRHWYIVECFVNNPLGVYDVVYTEPDEIIDLIVTCCDGSYKRVYVEDNNLKSILKEVWLDFATGRISL